MVRDLEPKGALMRSTLRGAGPTLAEMEALTRQLAPPIAGCQCSTARKAIGIPVVSEKARVIAINRGARQLPSFTRGKHIDHSLVIESVTGRCAGSVR